MALDLGFAVRRLLLFEVLIVVCSFGLGVGLALEFAGSGFGLILTMTEGFIRAFDFGLGLGEAAVRRLLLFGSFALLLGTASDSRPHSNGTIKRTVETFIRASLSSSPRYRNSN